MEHYIAVNNNCSRLIFRETTPVLLCIQAPALQYLRWAVSSVADTVYCSATQGETTVTFSPQILVECTVYFGVQLSLHHPYWRLIANLDGMEDFEWEFSQTTCMLFSYDIFENGIQCSRWHLFSDYYCFSLMNYYKYTYCLDLWRTSFLMLYKEYLEGKVSHYFLCTNC